MTNLRLVFTLDPSTNICVPTTPLPFGKRLSVSPTSALKLHAAHVGHHTSYIVGHAAPNTIVGITAIPETFELSTGHKATGTMFMVFDYNGPKHGTGQLTVSGCTLVFSFDKG